MAADLLDCYTADLLGSLGCQRGVDYVLVVLHGIPVWTVYNGLWRDGTVYRRIGKYRGRPIANRFVSQWLWLMFIWETNESAWFQ